MARPKKDSCPVTVCLDQIFYDRLNQFVDRQLLRMTIINGTKFNKESDDEDVTLYN